MRGKFLKTALSLADAVLRGSRLESTEHILKELVQRSNDNKVTDMSASDVSEALHTYIGRMNDHQAAARFTLKYLRDFIDTSTAIQLLYMCICHLMW